MKTKKLILIVIGVLVCVIFGAFCGCAASGREYNDDITVLLPDRDGVLVIREWSVLLGSGAEVYYDYGWRAPILLGQTSGADDGYCPFEAGEYRITQEEDAVTLAWRATDAGVWRSATFDLPNEAALKRQGFVIVAVAVAAVLAVGIGIVVAVRRVRKKKRS